MLSASVAEIAPPMLQYNVFLKSETLKGILIAFVGLRSQIIGKMKWEKLRGMSPIQ